METISPDETDISMHAQQHKRREFVLDLAWKVRPNSNIEAAAQPGIQAAKEKMRCTLASLFDGRASTTRWGAGCKGR